MIKTLKILGALLTYPTEDMIKVLPEMMEELVSEKWLPEKSLHEISKLAEALQSEDIYDLQETYVALFDRTPSLSLYMFEHIHGDSRDRGQALVDLDEVYRDTGLYNDSEHTPDYLPLFLEYLALLPAGEAKENLEGPSDVFVALAARLKKRDSLYSSVIEALPVLCGRKPDKDLVRKALETADGHIPSQKEMDDVWEEQFAMEVSSATAGADGDCPKAREMLARMENLEEVRQ
jgi:nitrate reductase delta subunit